MSSMEIMDDLDNLPISQESAIKKVMEANKNKINWSSEFPTQLKKNARKVTIYQLMLESRLELKSDGQRITCSKVVPMKKRKKLPQSNTSSANPISNLPEPNTRSIYVSAFEAAVNSSNPTKLRKYFEDYANPDKIVFQIDMSALSPDPKNIIIYRELKSIPTIVSYLYVSHLVIPDSVTIYWQQGIKKLEHGEREIETVSQIIGTRMNEMEVVETIVPSNEEQHILEEAILGLASLSQSKPVTNEINPNPTSSSSEKMEIEVDMVNQDSSAEDGSLPPSIHEKMKSLFKNKNQVVKSLDAMSLLIANENVEFRVGKPIPTPGEISVTGKFFFYLDNHKKVTKLRYVMNRPEKRPPKAIKNPSTASTTASSSAFTSPMKPTSATAAPEEKKVEASPQTEQKEFSLFGEIARQSKDAEEEGSPFKTQKNLKIRSSHELFEEMEVTKEEMELDTEEGSEGEEGEMVDDDEEEEEEEYENNDEGSNNKDSEREAESPSSLPIEGQQNSKDDDNDDDL